MGLKDEIEVLKRENENLRKENEKLKDGIEELEKAYLDSVEKLKESSDKLEVLEKTPKTKLIKLLNKELGSERQRLTTDFLAGIELLTRSIGNLGGE